MICHRLSGGMSHILYIVAEEECSEGVNCKPEDLKMSKLQTSLCLEGIFLCMATDAAQGKKCFKSSSSYDRNCLFVNLGYTRHHLTPHCQRTLGLEKNMHCIDNITQVHGMCHIRCDFNGR